MNDDTTPLPTTAPTPRAPHRRRTLLLVGTAAALGLAALGVTSAVASSSGTGGRAAVSTAYDSPRGTGQAPAAGSKEGDKNEGTSKPCGGPPGKGHREGHGPGDGPRPPAGKGEGTRPTPKDGHAPRPAPKDGVSRPAPKDGDARPTPKDGDSRPAPKDGDARPTPKDGDTRPAPKDCAAAPTSPETER